MSERLYSLLLWLYPHSFRERYAEEMRRVFRDRLRDEPALRVWIDVLADAVFSIPQQYLRSAKVAHHYPASAAPLFAATGTTIGLVALSSALFTASIVVALFIQGGWPLTVVATVVCLAVLMRVRRITQIVKSYHAEASDDAVTVRCDGLGMALTLRRAEVTGVHVFEKLGMRIRAVDPTRDLWVPAGTAAYADVSARLTQWAPVSVTSPGAALVASADNRLWRGLDFALCAFFPLPAATGFAIASTVFAVVRLFTRRPSAFRIALGFVPGAIVLARWLF